jgi:hypothetical protein
MKDRDYMVPTTQVSFEALWDLLVASKRVNVCDADTMEDLFTASSNDESVDTKEWIDTIRRYEVYDINYSDDGLYVYVKLPPSPLSD